ncbi:MAG: hypothetical protein E7388_02815 [Ruminococcaceae bacterium]|nr:hypothetical protein [Oscillospiraceae bacterium]
MKESFNVLERKLVLELTRFLDYDTEYLRSLLSESLDMSWVLGQLCWHRVAGVAYYILNNSGLLNKTNRDFRFSLQSIYEASIQRNLLSKEILSDISKVLSNANFKYAFLKGSFLSSNVYPEGLRTSNDFDMLISPSSVTACEKLLKANEFIQGYYQPGEAIFPASRHQVVESRLTRGETVPFVKKGLDKFDVIEIDLNFSLDSKNGNESQVCEMLKHVTPFSPKSDTLLYTLCPMDFIIHLCMHLYKEASVYFWVEKKRDLSIYKFCDIYALLLKWGEISFFQKLADRIQHFGVEKECCYALSGTLECYPSLTSVKGFLEMLKKITPQDTTFMKEIVQPKTGDVYSYEQPFIDWLFLSDRFAHIYIKSKGDSL